MIATTHKKQALFVASVAAMLICASAAQAAPAGSKNKTVQIHEVHRDDVAPRKGSPVQNVPLSEEGFRCRSHAELVMINPG